MASFPNRIRRVDFGPKLKDRKSVVNPTTDVGAGALNPAFHSLAGLAQVSGLAFVRFRYTSGTTMVVLAHREAWAPDGGSAAPVVTYNNTGDYTVTYPGTVLDENGNAVALAFSGAIVSHEAGPTAPAVFTGGTQHSYSLPSGNVVRLFFRGGGGQDDTDPYAVSLLIF